MEPAGGYGTVLVVLLENNCALAMAVFSALILLIIADRSSSSMKALIIVYGLGVHTKSIIMHLVYILLLMRYILLLM